MATGIGVIWVLVFASGASALTTIYSDDFEMFTPGADLTELSYTPTLGGVNAASWHTFLGGATTSAAAYGGSVAAQLDLPRGGGSEYLGQLFTPYGGVLTRVEFDFTALTQPGGFGGCFVRLPAPAPLGMQVLFGFMDDGSVVTFSADPAPDTLVTLGSFDANTTYHVRLDYDLSAETYSIFLAGTPLLVNQAIPDYLITTSIDRFGFDSNEAFADSMGNQFIVDNLIFQVGERAPEPTTFVAVLFSVAVLAVHRPRRKPMATS